jgi:hypothetical protein
VPEQVLLEVTLRHHVKGARNQARARIAITRGCEVQIAAVVTHISHFWGPRCKLPGGSELIVVWSSKPYILAIAFKGTRAAVQLHPDDFGNALGCRHTHRVAADLRGPLLSKCSSVRPLADGLSSGARKSSYKPGAGFAQCRL